MAYSDITQEEALMIVNALNAISRSGGSSPEFRLAIKIETVYDVESSLEKVIEYQKIAANELKEGQ